MWSSHKINSPLKLVETFNFIILWFLQTNLKQAAFTFATGLNETKKSYYNSILFDHQITEIGQALTKENSSLFKASL